MDIESETVTDRADFRQIFAQMDSVVLWSATGSDSFDYLSPAFESLWGIDRDVIREDIEAFVETIHPEDREIVQEVNESVEFDEPFSGEALQPIEYRIVRPDGEVRWVETRFSGIEEDDGLAEVIGITIDVTDRKRREQKIEVLTRLLRHDIYNDVTAILGWLETLRGSMTANQRSLVDRAQSASQHVIQLTELAREYVDVVTDEDEFSLRPVTLSSVLHEELEAARLLYPEANIDVDGTFVAREIRGNELLGSVFRNVLNNAVQHNDSEVPEVVVSTSAHDSMVVVRVTDNGPGIPTERRERVFETPHPDASADAVGMGLYLSRKTVEGFGGRIWVEDNEPTGTVVCLELPLWENQ